MNPILQLSQVTGGYQYNRPIIHQLSFSLKPGEMIGLIGLNGAGKSTTIKHILGLMQPFSGSIQVHGQTLSEAPEQYRKAMSYVPETPLVYEDLTLREHLELTAMAYNIPQKTYEQRLNQLLEEFHMTEKTALFPQHMSKGMRQKMMIMNAFLVNPSLYVIDEPFIGLDPLGIRSLLEMMVTVKQTGAAILISSHILSTLERYCDRFVVLHQGQIRAIGTLDEIRREMGMTDALLDDLFYELTKDPLP